MASEQATSVGRTPPAARLTHTQVVLERRVLAVLVLGRGKAAELVEALSLASESQLFLARLQALPSDLRQGKVATDFGLRPDWTNRLRSLMAEATEPLRDAIHARLPPYARSLFPDHVPSGEGAGAAEAADLDALADRLIQEALR